MVTFLSCEDQSELINNSHGSSSFDFFFFFLFFSPCNSVLGRGGAGVVVLLLEQAGLHSSCGEGSRL